ncbi:hypothetical protein LCGC14_2423760, partial [marine sediment metagenome]
FAARWDAHRGALAADPALAPAGIVVIGGGVGGVELAMAMAHGGARAAGRPVAVSVIDRGTALDGLGDGAARALRARLAAFSITLHEHSQVDRVTADAVHLGDGCVLPARFVVGAAGAHPHRWLAGTGLDLHEGFVTVGPTLQSSDPAIFATGDCAHLSHAPRPKAGVFAVRQAPILHDNLRAALSGGTLRRYAPQRDYLKLISTGGKAAVADKWGLRLEGRALWQWKDRIDRKFMNRLADLPPMADQPLPRQAADGLRDMLAGGQAPCGGCGAKVGRAGLTRALATLPAAVRTDVVTGAGDDAAILRSPEGRHQVLTTDQLRGFTEDPYVMARITALHALGDIWAMGAQPQAALVNLILPRLSDRLEGRMLAEIMQAASEVMGDAGAQIVGGHTATGPELSIGFSLTGLLAGPPLTLAGAQPGDRLILTRPIGSGTLLAAEMAMQAPGDWVADALAEMARPQQEAARILGAAHAMTDVTGFGLAGHLLSMLDASGVGATLSLAHVPLMTGARELAARGVRSTLHD